MGSETTIIIIDCPARIREHHEGVRSLRPTRGSRTYLLVNAGSVVSGPKQRNPLRTIERQCCALSIPFLFIPHGLTYYCIVAFLYSYHEHRRFSIFQSWIVLKLLQSKPENVCKICQKTFTRKADCTRHARLHAGIKCALFKFPWNFTQACSDLIAVRWRDAANASLNTRR